ncbi:MAG: alpha/beta hydrolase [Clostridiales bacterium]|nr:alpha/beta hydrolase [Clostridiales bacterium]
MKKGFILLPGAGMSDWIWSKLIPRLKGPSFPIAQRIRENTYENRMNCNFQMLVDHVNKEIENAGLEQVILVAHSGAGFIAAEAAKQNSKVKHVVYLAANIPPHKGHALSQFSSEIYQQNIDAIQKQASMDLFPMKQIEKSFRDYFCNLLQEEDITYLLEQNFQPEPVCVITHHADWSDYPAVNMTYVACSEDRTLQLSQQKQMAENLGISDFRIFPAGHMVMVQCDQMLAKLLNQVWDELL